MARKTAKKTAPRPLVGVVMGSDSDLPVMQRCLDTLAGFGNALYAVNARFGTPPTPDTAYDLVRVLKP